ncbi:ATP synthase F1 subunit delta [candidate division GN15 bacterium]|uniref:ATP synthase subunit delta n=1 Tax=candidate division GN15 bacterium TaxID=2072418 RepID=A0A855WZH4_9BACT|nr:MAG: ATP synthase F1 subunit delta [candidate division GN15 bacterium]
MLSREVAHKYAHALFMSAKAKNLLDKADEQFLQLRQLLVSDPTLFNFLNAPQVSDEKKLELVRNVFAGRLERPFVEFLIVLVEKHRTQFLPDIAEELDRMIKAAKGIGKVTVITAIPISPLEEQELIKQLAKKTGLKIELEKKVDRQILGGMITILHDQIIDGSVRHGLSQIQEQLEKVKVH